MGNLVKVGSRAVLGIRHGYALTAECVLTCSKAFDYNLLILAVFLLVSRWVLYLRLRVTLRPAYLLFGKPYGIRRAADLLWR
jgi:hypothetical protein